MTVKARTMKKYAFFLLGMMVLLMAGLLPFDVLAAGPDTLKTTIKNTSQQVGTLPKLISVLSYVAGSFFAVRALFALKGFIEKPDDNPVNNFIGLATLSMLLILLPYSLGLTSNTIGIGSGYVLNSTTGSFYKEVSSCSGTGKGLNVVFCNLAKEMQPFSKLIAIFSYVTAASLLLTGLLDLKGFGDDPGDHPLRSIVMKFVLASMLISLPFAMDLFVTAATGDSVSTKATTKMTAPKLYKNSTTTP